MESVRSVVATNVELEAIRARFRRNTSREAGFGYTRAAWNIVCLSGRRRARTPVREKSALATAAAIGGTPSWPTPDGGSVDRTMYASTVGASQKRTIS